MTLSETLRHTNYGSAVIYRPFPGGLFPRTQAFGVGEHWSPHCSRCRFGGGTKAVGRTSQLPSRLRVRRRCRTCLRREPCQVLQAGGQSQRALLSAFHAFTRLGTAPLRHHGRMLLDGTFSPKDCIRLRQFLRRFFDRFNYFCIAGTPA